MEAPSPSFDFLGAPVATVPEVPELSREVPLPSLAGRAAVEDVSVRGAWTEGVPAGDVGVDPDADAAELDERLRPMIGGVEILGVLGADDLGVVGLDHESKKSSSVSSFTAGEIEASTPSTTMPFGNLTECQCIGREGLTI